MKADPTDTSVDAADRLRNLLRARSGEQRLRMACEMFDAARRLAVASFPESVQNDPVERRIRLLRRLYLRDLAPAALEAIVARLRHPTLQAAVTNDSPLQALNKDEREQTRQWLANWKRLGPILEGKRRTRVASLTDDDAWDESQQLLQAWQPGMAGDGGEGIRLQQDLFARCRRSPR